MPPPPQRPPRPPVRTPRTEGAIERAPARGRPVRTSRMGSGGPREEKKRSPLLPVAIALVVVLGGLVAWKLTRPPPGSPPPPVSGKPAELFKEAKGLARQGKWSEAKAKLEALKEEEPDYEPRQIENYLKVAQTEIPSQLSLAEATEAIARGELGKASAALAQVKTTTQQAALDAAKLALDAKASARVTEMRTLLSTANDVAKLQRVKVLGEDLLAFRADDREGAELKHQAELGLGRLQNRTGPTLAPETPWLEVQQRYKSGDASGALSLAQACANKYPQCSGLEGKIKDFEAKSHRLEDLGDAELLALFELDRKIAGDASSEQSQPLRKQLASKFFLKASQARTTGNWSRAIEYAQQVLRAEPGNAGAQALVNDGRAQGRDLYFRAYQQLETSPDEAAKLLKDVLALTPADDEFHVKAVARLAELQKK